MLYSSPNSSGTRNSNPKLDLNVVQKIQQQFMYFPNNYVQRNKNIIITTTIMILFNLVMQAVIIAILLRDNTILEVLKNNPFPTIAYSTFVLCNITLMSCNIIHLVTNNT